MGTGAAQDRGELPQVAILFSQFAAYHIDRVEAAALQLKGRARVLAVECASASRTYAWERASGLIHAEHQTLFPGRDYESLGRLERLAAYRRALADVDVVLVGVPYSEPDILVLSWWLHAQGKRVFVMTESKRDDRPRNPIVEAIKRALLSCYDGAIVGGPRQRAYLRSLGFAEKPVLPGYDTVGLDRLRAQAGPNAVRWEDRPLLYVGRFVSKKNLAMLLRGYALYVERAGPNARQLVLAGDGELAGELRALAAELGVADRVEFTGFLTAPEIAERMSGALALCLVSTEEQWGLVVNEAAAFGVPALVSTPVGARDALVRDGETGFVIDPHSAERIGQALAALAASEAEWHRLSNATSQRAWLGDTARFAEAVEAVLYPESTTARDGAARFWTACEVG